MSGRWLVPPPTTPGLVVIILAETGLLLAAGVFNPSFVTYRMCATQDGYMSRVVAAWSISSKTIQPCSLPSVVPSRHWSAYGKPS